MLNNISTDSVHRKNIWTDSLNNIFYNGCISDEEMKVYCFGDGGGGDGADGGVAADFGDAEFGIGADPVGAEGALGGKTGTQSDDTGISDAITDAMSGTLGGTMSDDAAFGPAAVDPAVPDSDASVFSGDDIDEAFPSSFSIIGSPFSILGSALLSAIPVIGPVLGIASTVMGAIGTIGDVIGEQGLSTIGDFSPTSLASKGLSSLATEMGVPSTVTSALSSPVLSVEVGNQQTGITSGLIGGIVDVIDPQAQTQFGIDVPIGKSAFAGVQDTFSNIPASIEQGLSSIGLQGDTSYSSFDDSGSDNPIAVTAAKATGGLVSLRDNGGPVVSDAQKAYMNWLASVGGRQALSKRSLQQGRIDEIITDAGPEYFSYHGQENPRAAGLYDDDIQDYQDFPFAYPEHPDFRRLNALGGGPRNIPQSVAPQNIVDVTRQAVIARRLSDEEKEKLRRLRRGLPVNVVNAVGAYTGGGIQQLVNQGPTLLDVVNKGMSIPEETIPSQRPQPFIKGQQPGGLRSTNYYTNAMQPASFYAQPQQVRNYGSIY